MARMVDFITVEMRPLEYVGHAYIKRAINREMASRYGLRYWRDERRQMVRKFRQAAGQWAYIDGPRIHIEKDLWSPYHYIMTIEGEVYR